MSIWYKLFHILVNFFWLLTLTPPDTVDNITETLQKLEDEMFALAKKMEFEKAAVCRDKITSLKRKLIDL